MIPDDPTNHDRPMRRKSHTETPITDPAPSGFFLVRDTVPAMLAQWAIAISLGVAIGMLAGCGPSDLQAARDVAADLADAQARQHELVQVDRIEMSLRGERPDGISPEDWAAAQHAVRVLQGRP